MAKPPQRANQNPPFPRKNQAPQETHRVTEVRHTETQVYEGAIPPPAMLEGFERVAPGTAQRLIDLAIEESEHRRALEMRALEANISTQAVQANTASYQSRAVFKSDMLGQVFGFLACLLCLGIAAYLAIKGDHLTAAAFAALPAAALVRSFIIKPGRNNKPPEQ